MFKFIKIPLFLVVAFFSIVQCTSSRPSQPKNESSAPKTSLKSWAGDMQEVSKNLEALMPFVFSREEFHNAKNRTQLQRHIERYAQSVSVIDQHIGEQMLGDDPLVRYNLNRLKESTQMAQQSFIDQHTEYSRSVLKESVGVCFNCHSTNQLGPQSQFSTQNLTAQFKMQVTERADYYIATRQYEKAIEILEAVIKKPVLLEGQPHEQLSALKRYLAIMIRVKDDPKRASHNISTMLNYKGLPYFLVSDGQVWLKSLREWQSEKPSRLSPVAQAERLIQKAKQMQSAGSFQAGYVDYLRATGLLHNALRAGGTSSGSLAEKAQIYFLLGSSYDVVSDLGVWDLPEVYFETCVRVQPKTDLAKKCFKSYERAIVLGFSGSGGVFIPQAEQEKLMALKKLAGF